MKNKKKPDIWGTRVTLLSYFSIHLPSLCFSLSPTAQLLSLSPHSFCTVSLMWHFQKPSLKLLSHRMVPIKSVVYLYFFLHKKNPNLSACFFCFSASVESVQIWPKPDTFETPLRSLQDGGREKEKKGEKKIQKSSCFIPFTFLFIFFLFVTQHLLSYYFGNFSYGCYYLRFINSEVISQINHFIS